MKKNNFPLLLQHYIEGFSEVSLGLINNFLIRYQFEFSRIYDFIKFEPKQEYIEIIFKVVIPSIKKVKCFTPIELYLKAISLTLNYLFLNEGNKANFYFNESQLIKTKFSLATHEPHIIHLESFINKLNLLMSLKKYDFDYMQIERIILFNTDNCFPIEGVSDLHFHSSDFPWCFVAKVNNDPFVPIISSHFENLASLKEKIKKSVSSIICIFGHGDETKGFKVILSNNCIEYLTPQQINACINRKTVIILFGCLHKVILNSKIQNNTEYLIIAQSITPREMEIFNYLFTQAYFFLSNVEDSYLYAKMGIYFKNRTFESIEIYKKGEKLDF